MNGTVPTPPQPTPPRDDNDPQLDPSPPPTIDENVEIAGTEADEKKGTPPNPQPVRERQDR